MRRFGGEVELISLKAGEGLRCGWLLMCWA